MSLGRIHLHRCATRWAFCAAVAVLLAAATLVRADAAVEPLPIPGSVLDPIAVETIGSRIASAVLVYVDGDHVVHSADEAPADAKAGAATTGSTYHMGFSTYGDADLLPHYEIRLVRSGRIDDVRPYVAEAMSEATAAGGQPLSLRADTIEVHGPGRGQIDIVVSSSSPCAGMWLGCGGPVIEDGVVVAGRIWINPRVFERPTSQLDNTVRHELGHTLGLGHYEYLHEGRVQTMHPTRFDAATYESGDIAGLRYTSSTPLTSPPSASVPVQASQVAADPVGSFDVAAGPFGMVVGGWALDPDTTAPVTVTVSVSGRSFDVVADRDAPDRPGHGFFLARLARQGSYEVCAVARNVGRGSDTALGCRSVVVAVSALSRLGLQTF